MGKKFFFFDEEEFKTKKKEYLKKKHVFELQTSLKWPIKLIIFRFSP